MNYALLLAGWTVLVGAERGGYLQWITGLFRQPAPLRLRLSAVAGSFGWRAHRYLTAEDRADERGQAGMRR